MPTPSPGCAFLAMANFTPSDDNDELDPVPLPPDDLTVPDESARYPRPWCFPRWQELSGIVANPLPGGHDETSIWNTPEDTDAVAVFFKKFSMLSESDQTDFCRRAVVDNDSAGRKLWLDFYVKGSATWKLPSIVYQVLLEHKFDVYSVMKRTKKAEVSLRLSKDY